MRGGLAETWIKVELGTRRTTERVRVGNSPPKVACAAILPDNEKTFNQNTLNYHYNIFTI